MFKGSQVYITEKVTMKQRLEGDEGGSHVELREGVPGREGSQ